MLKKDQALILAIDKESTGMYIHDSNVLVSAYSYYAEKDNQEMFDRLETKLRVRLVKIRLMGVKA